VFRSVTAIPVVTSATSVRDEELPNSHTDGGRAYVQVES